MTAKRPTLLLALVSVTLAALLAFVAPGRAAPLPTALLWHPKLLRSLPAADQVVTASPTVVKLWFSERVELGISRIRLVNARDATVGTGRVARIPGGDEATLMTPITVPLPPGVYTVHWITASTDGHAMRGSFAFTVGPAVAR
jgi:hypothetical protein